MRVIASGTTDADYVTEFDSAGPWTQMSPIWVVFIASSGTGSLTVSSRLYLNEVLVEERTGLSNTPSSTGVFFRVGPRSPTEGGNNAFNGLSVHGQLTEMFTTKRMRIQIKVTANTRSTSTTMNVYAQGYRPSESYAFREYVSFRVVSGQQGPESMTSWGNQTRTLWSIPGPGRMFGMAIAQCTNSGESGCGTDNKLLYDFNNIVDKIAITGGGYANALGLKHENMSANLVNMKNQPTVVFAPSIMFEDMLRLQVKMTRSFTFPSGIYEINGTAFIGLYETFEGEDEFAGTWVQIGGDSLNSGWGAGYETVESLAFHPTNGKLWAGLGHNTAGSDGEIWELNGTTWTKIGGDGLNSSWSAPRVDSLICLNTGTPKLYAGIGGNTNDAEVWEWSGSSWTKIGGDGVNSSWSGHESVRCMAQLGTDLIVGLGEATGDAEVWKWSGSAWTKIGGDGVNSSWNTNYEQVMSMTVHTSLSEGSVLYVGLGTGVGDAEVWKWNGTVWSQVGGDGINGSWATAANKCTVILAQNTIAENEKIYACIGIFSDNPTNGEAEVWEYNPATTTWTQVAGDDDSNGSWDTTFGYERCQCAMMRINPDTGQSELYVGMGFSTNDADLWRYSPTNSTWKRIGSASASLWGDKSRVMSVASNPASPFKVVIGTGTSDGEVWELTE